MHVKRRLKWHLAGLLVALAVPCAGQPFVQTQVLTIAQARAAVGGPSVTDTVAEGSDTAALLVASAFAQMNPATSSADAIASLGFLRAQAFTTFPAFVDGDAGAMAQSVWTDSFLIDSPAHTGELAQMTASALVDGFVDITGGGFARVSVGASAGSNFAGGMQQEFLESGPTTGGLSPELLISFFFTIGTPFQFSMSLLVEVDRTGTTPGAVDVNFFDSVVWNGIDAVTVGGSPLSGYAFNSLSGLDYRESFAIVPPPPPGALPEPGTGLLLLAGLALLWIGRRRID